MKHFLYFALFSASVLTIAISCNKAADGVTPATTTTGTVVASSLVSSVVLSPIPVSSVPATATAYIAANYGGWTVVSAENETHAGVTTYELRIQNGTAFKEVVFDGNGAFLGEELQGARGYHGGRNNNSIPIDSLPTTVTTYITANYAGDTIKRAEKLTIKGSTYYAVLVDNGTQVQALIFDGSGTFLRVATFAGGRQRRGCDGPFNSAMISVDSLPQSIPLYVTTNYAGYTIAVAEKEKDRLTGAYFYEVGILNGTSRMILIFDATGTFVRAI